MKSSFLHLKKATAFLILILLGLSLSSCQAVGDPIILSLGIYHQRDFYSEGGFQDFTDYGKYYFKSANADNNAYFTQITSADIPVIHEHLDDFEAGSNYSEAPIPPAILFRIMILTDASSTPKTSSI